jgi:hypothetical protein
MSIIFDFATRVKIGRELDSASEALKSISSGLIEPGEMFCVAFTALISSNHKFTVRYNRR